MEEPACRRIDPVRLPLERVGRQRHPAPVLCPEARRIIHRHARHPQLCQAPQWLQRLPFGRARPQLARYDHPPRCLLMSSGQTRQRLACSHLQQHPVLPGQQRCHAVCKPHTPPDLPDPVFRIRRLLCRDPSARHVRHECQLRCIQLHLRQHLPERLQHRLDPVRVKRMRHLQPAHQNTR